MASSDSSRRTSGPTSTLLQDMLREKKAHTQRVHKTYDMEAQGNGVGDREIQSSPMDSRAPSGTSGRRLSGAGVRQVSLPKVMGMKEMEQHLSKINKQNFDLKLEVFHRRQQNDILEAKIEKMEELEANNEEMQSINEDLLLELEKRDVAIREAVNLICDLEAKIEEMGEAEMLFSDSSRTPRKPSLSSKGDRRSDLPHDESKDSQNSTSQTGIHSHVQQTVAPPRTSTLSPTPANSARRIPSFLRENKKSTTMLRSLYSNDASVGPPASIFSCDDGEEEEDDDAHMINSPRLSILSESGFASIYGDKKDSDGISPRHDGAIDDLEVSPAPHARSPSPRSSQRGKRVQKWIDEKNKSMTPTRASAKSGVDDHFSSIGEMLENVPSANKQEEDAGLILDGRNNNLSRSPLNPERKKTRDQPRRPSSPAFGGPMFGGAMLPPTPGTMSTATIAGNSSTPSIVTEKSLLDGAPIPAKGYSALIPPIRSQSSALDIDFVNSFDDATDVEDDSDREPESPSRNRSPKSTRFAQPNAPSRPRLSTSATDTVCSGEGYASISPSRTLSYPSPYARARRLSNQLSPTSEKSHDSFSERSISQKSDMSSTMTPPKRDTRGSMSRSPPKNREPFTPSADLSNTQSEMDMKTGRSASLRSKMNKLSLTPSQSSHQSIASRLFRRSNSQSVSNSSAQNTTPSRPPMTRETSSSRHARVPRPTSMYGSSPIHGQRPKSKSISKYHRNNAPKQESDPIYVYTLTSILPDGMLTEDDYSDSSRDSRER